MTQELVPRSFDDLLKLLVPCSEIYGRSPSDTPSSTKASSDDPQYDESEERSKEQEEADTFHERQIVKAIGLDVLGKLDGNAIKVFSTYYRRSSIIQNVSKLTFEELLLICGPPVRSRVQVGMVDDNISDIYSLTDVKRAIAMLAGHHPLSEKPEVGLGVWQGRTVDDKPYKSCVLVSSNEAAELNGDNKLRRLTNPRCRGHVLDFDSTAESWYNHKHLSELVDQCDEKFAKDTRNAVVELFQKWKWANGKPAPVVAAGLVFASWVQTFWDWRPQIAIVGATNTGKTTFFNCLTAIFGKLCMKSSMSSAAGLRQIIASTAKILLCDEFEQSKHRIDILEMLRAAGRGDLIYRGTSGQKGKGFSLSHIVWVAAIEAGLSKAADRNRFITLELAKPDDDKRGKLTLPSDSDLHELGQRVLAVSIKYVHTAKALATKMRDTRIPGVDSRVIESYAVPAAMMSVIEGYDEQTSRGVLVEMIRGMRQSEVAEAKDEAFLLETVLSASIRIRSDNYNVSDLIKIIMHRGNNFDDARKELGNYGLSVGTFGDSEEVPEGKSMTPCLIIAHKMVRDKLLRSTPWYDQSIEQILGRIEGAISGVRKRVGSQRPATVCIPLSYLCREHLAIDEETPPPDAFE